MRPSFEAHQPYKCMCTWLYTSIRTNIPGISKCCVDSYAHRIKVQRTSVYTMYRRIFVRYWLILYWAVKDHISHMTRASPFVRYTFCTNYSRNLVQGPDRM